MIINDRFLGRVYELASDEGAYSEYWVLYNLLTGEHGDARVRDTLEGVIADSNAEAIKSFLSEQAPLLDRYRPYPINEQDHCCEFNLLMDRERLHLEAYRLIEQGVGELEGSRMNSNWKPIETAPNNRSVLLAIKGSVIPLYCGRKRQGGLGEPQQSKVAWRCDSSGRFANPTHWTELPEKP